MPRKPSTCSSSAAAIYAARKGIRTGVAVERFGGQALDTLAIENFISVIHTEGPKLATGLEQHVKEYGVDIMNLQRAEALIPGDGRWAMGEGAKANLSAFDYLIRTSPSSDVAEAEQVTEEAMS